MRTAEFVTPKHPDKMCDQISDAIVDFALGIDPNARVAAEVMGGHGRVYIMGEMTIHDTGAGHLLPTAIKGIVEEVTGKGDLDISINIVQQSLEIAQGVDVGGAGDQGIMRGYATRETASYMPLEYHLARGLCQYLYEKHPVDGKTQITLDKNSMPVAVVASFQNVPGSVLRREVEQWLEAMCMVSRSVDIHANPAGDWSQGGFDADTGLTGRKLAVDNYGPSYPIGGGAFSGKDATKVDRSGAYMARKIAVDYLRKYEATEVSVELAYAIGVAQPVEATAKVNNEFNVDLLTTGGYDLTPEGIIKLLGLRAPQFQETAKWGHFGNDFRWDK